MATKYFRDTDGQVYRATEYEVVSEDELKAEQERLRAAFREVGSFISPVPDVPVVAAPEAPVAPAAPVDRPIQPVAVTPPVQPLVQDVAPATPAYPSIQ